MNVPILNRYLLGLATFICYTLFSVTWKAGDIIISNMDYDVNSLGTLSATLIIVKVFTNILAGVITAKFMKEKLFLKQTQLFMFGSILLGVAIFTMTLSDNFMVLTLARAGTGMGGAFVLFAMNPLVSYSFPENELPIINGINMSGFNIGIALMLSLSVYMTNHTEQVVNIVVVLLAIFTVVFWFANRPSTAHMKNRLEKIGDSSQEVDDSDEEPWGFKDALTNRFNWIFAVALTGVQAFYYVAFTFLDEGAVSYMLYAGVIGNILGIFGAKAMRHLVVVRVCSIISFALAIVFMTNLDVPMIKYVAMVLGGVMFFALPSYITLGFSQDDATPKKIGFTFMMLWFVSDVVASIFLKIYAYLTSVPELASTAVFFILGVNSLFLIGAFLMKFKKKESPELEAATES